MVIIKLLSFLALCCFSLSNASADNSYTDVVGDACEKVTNGESKSSARLRASDRATFLAVKKLDLLTNSENMLSDHDFNVMIYRIVDEYIEDLSVNSVSDDDDKVCVKVTGKILSANVQMVRDEFLQKAEPVKSMQTEEVEKIVEHVENSLKIKPENPDSLALLHVKSLEYFNGSKSVKYANLLKKHVDNSQYFYLTEDAEVADYVVTPKLLKAKVDVLDAGNKRLHMALVLEINGLGKEIVSEYQNRFVLFGAEENEQTIASRLIAKLLEQAGDGMTRKIEHHQQQKLESQVLGRDVP